MSWLDIDPNTTNVSHCIYINFTTCKMAILIGSDSACCTPWTFLHTRGKLYQIYFINPWLSYESMQYLGSVLSDTHLTGQSNFSLKPSLTQNFLLVCDVTVKVFLECMGPQSIFFTLNWLFRLGIFVVKLIKNIVDTCKFNEPHENMYNQ